MAINREATIRWKGYDPNDLKPRSSKRIWANCDDCEDGRWVSMDSYCNLCPSCAAIKRWSDQGNRNVQSNRLTEYWSDQGNRNDQTEKLKQYNKDHPEAGEAHSEWMLEYCKDNPEIGKEHSEWLIQYNKDHPEVGLTHSEFMTKYYEDQGNRNDQADRLTKYWADQSNRDEMSEIITNSDAHKTASEMKRGGNDICDHHYIYDHANPELYTMKVTRSKHTKIHMWMKKVEIVVPHINEDAGEWRYVS